MSDAMANQSSLLKKAFLAIQDLEAKLAKAEGGSGEPIAIVGMACRFPGGADDPESFWELLRSGRDAVTPAPADRWDQKPGRGWAGLEEKWEIPSAGFLKQAVDAFDAGYFGVSPREAAALDPQQRMALEVAVETLEDAGLPLEKLHGSLTGVFLGMAGTDFSQRVVQAGFPDELMSHYVTGVAHSVAAGRISYVLGLQGPSLAVDTACSSALVAVHLACQSLRAGECTLALAGGVNLMLAPETTAVFTRMGVLSPEGRCKTFDEDADGFARGEGCGFVALKRLSGARADGDRILAVIRGSAVNQDGASSSLTAPNGPSQEALMRAALAQAGLRGGDVSYVEAHGTGTPLGDPVELQGLGAVYGAAQPEQRRLLVGSLKTNMGHLEGAAGIAGLMKLVLALEHRQIPPHLHLRQPTTRVKWEALRLAVPRTLTEWETGGRSRIAAVSAFGFSGTNAHVIVEEASEKAAVVRNSTWPVQVLTASAKSPAALGKLVAAYRRELEQYPEKDLEDVCFTANAGRSHFGSRISFAAADRAGMVQELAAYTDPAKGRGENPGRIGFLFTGQGSQFPGMGRELYESSVVYREAVERCNAVWQELTGASLTDALYARGSELKEAREAQPALFALEYGLAELWRSWGMEPALVLGHSLGEYVAAVVAGLVTLEDGLRLVQARAELMDGLTVRGGMRAVAADAEQVRRALAGWEHEVAIAAINGPASVVISGSAEGLKAVAGKLEAEGVRTRELEVSHAFHSPLLEPMLGEFEARAEKIAFGKPRLRMVSNVTGRVAGAGEMGRARYWREHMRQTVEFHAGLAAALAAGCTTFIEMGPQPHLLSLAKTAMTDSKILWLASMRRGRSAWLDLLSSARALYEDGAEIDWAAVHEKRGRKVALPAYPWERQRYPLPPLAAKESASLVAAGGGHPLLGARLASPLEDIQFQSVIGPTQPAWLGDHVLHGKPLVPAAGYLEMALSAARMAGLEETAVESVAVLQPCFFEEVRILQTVLRKTEGGASFAIHSRCAAEPKEWVLHATGELTAGRAASDVRLEKLAVVRQRCSRALPVSDFYTNFAERGLNFGPAFQPLISLQVGNGEAVAEFAIPAEAQEEADSFTVHPIALDACVQAVAAAVMSRDSGGTMVALPAGLERLRVTADARRLTVAHARVTTNGGDLRAEFQGLDSDGNVLLVGEGMIFRTQSQAAERAGASSAKWFYEVDWVPPSVDAKPLEWAEGHRWLLFGDEEEAQKLATLLTKQGIAHDRGDLNAAGSLEATGPLSDVVYVARQQDTESDWKALRECLRVAQKVAGYESNVPLRFWVMTRTAQGPGLTDPEQAAVWGLARSMALEFPEMRVIRVDLDGSSPAAEDWMSVLRAAGEEDEMVVRGGEVLVSRMRRKTSPVWAPAGSGPPVQLSITERGTLEGLQLLPVEGQAPGEGEVEIEVRAAGLNFRDVLNVLGMYKGRTGPLGGECAGVVTRVGAGVSRVKPGDEVAGVGPGCFRSFVTLDAESVWLKPERLSFAAAAALPIAFLTAQYALVEVARIQPGESVLIHAGAGGVGLAAVQVARTAGAVVMATAGSEEKRAYLRAMGVEHVMNSRSAEFATEVREATQGRGVDVVLNSLVGPLIDAGFAALAQGGRFLELGVADLRSEAWVRGARPDVRYFPIDLSDRPEIVACLLSELMERFSGGNLQPLPHAVFAMEEAQDAFRWMAQARHIGKVILAPSRREPVAIRKDGAYLVTGGLFGLGLQVAQWLAQRGAGEVVVMGRRPPSSEAVEILDTMRKAGTTVTVRQGDVSQESDVAASIETTLPLRGIFHCAGTLEDAALVRQDWSGFERVLAGKAEGARYLDRLTRNSPLDAFVLFSSIAGVMGSPGQSNYAAANAFLDAFAQRRRSKNLPALSVRWGAWGETGMAVRQGVVDRGVRSGMSPMAIRDGLSALEGLMESGAGPHAMVLAMNWKQYLHGAAPAWHRWLLSDVEKGGAGRGAAENGRGKAESWVEKLRATSRTQQRSLLRGLLEERIRRTLGLAEEQAIPVGQPLQELGLDSLLSIELRNSLGASLQRGLPATLLFNHPTLAALTDYLLTVVGMEESARTGGQRPKPGRRSLLEDIEALSDAEVERMLSEQASREKAGQEVL